MDYCCTPFFGLEVAVWGGIEVTLPGNGVWQIYLSCVHAADGGVDGKMDEWPIARLETTRQKASSAEGGIGYLQAVAADLEACVGAGSCVGRSK